MTLKNWGSLAIVIALIVFLVIMADIYYVKPAYELDLPDVGEASAKAIKNPPIKKATGGSVKGDITATSKKIIVAKYPERTVAKEREEKPDFYRNPFLWPGELKPPPRKTRKPGKIPVLGMICFGDNNKLAILNNTPVREGSKIDGHTVEKIAKKYVLLSGSYGVIRIAVPKHSFGPCKIEMLSQTSLGASKADELAQAIKTQSDSGAGVPALIEKLKSKLNKGIENTD